MKKSHSKYFKASLAVAASGLSVSSAHAAVISTQHNETLNWNPDSTSELSFDITADGTDDYKFVFSNNNVLKPQITSADFGAGDTNKILFPEVDADLDAEGIQQSKTLPVLSEGTTIDGSLFGGHSLEEAFFYLNYDENFYGDWGGTPTGSPIGKEAPNPVIGPVEGYVGLAVDAGEGNYNYGYAHVRVDMSGVDDAAQSASVTVICSGFETEVNTAVVAENCIPEPSTIALLASGAVGLASLRRWSRSRE